MKKLIILSASAIMLYALPQVCGCGSCDAQQREISISKIIDKNKEVTLKITGMTCAGCASHVSSTLDKIDGVLDHEVKFPGNIAIVKYDPKKTSEKEIIAAIKKIGYKAEVMKRDEKTDLK